MLAPGGAIEAANDDASYTDCPGESGADSIRFAVVGTIQAGADLPVVEDSTIAENVAEESGGNGLAGGIYVNQSDLVLRDGRRFPETGRKGTPEGFSSPPRRTP